MGVDRHGLCRLLGPIAQPTACNIIHRCAIFNRHWVSIVKKSGLDPDEPQNYRPISNLTFTSKVIERIMAEQMHAHLTECDLMPPVQSAYRQGHSTETVLMKVFADIIDAADNQHVTLLGLLDMSAAFDTVDHSILLRRHDVSYGITGQVLHGSLHS